MAVFIHKVLITFEILSFMLRIFITVFGITASTTGTIPLVSVLMEKAAFNS